MLNLGTDILNINRVGASTAKKLKKLGIETVRDLLFYFPFRYDDFTSLTPIDKLQAGVSANVVGQIELIQNKRSWKRRMNITEALISDNTETIKVVWFNQPFIAKNLHVGDKISLAGKVEDDYGSFIMKSPTYEKIPLTPFIKGGNNAIHTQGLVPNYHLTANITHKQVRFLIKQVINLSGQITDWLPAEVKKSAKLINLSEAVKKIHFPKDNLDIKKARERLAFNELFLIQLQSQLIKKSLSLSRAAIIKFKEQETKKFVDNLPFKLTDAQRKAAWEILKDLENNKPMSRLLEGDVGSGKTMVAIIAMLNIALNKKQAVLMVPTEILARQHYETVSKFLIDFNIKVGLITRSQKQISNRKEIVKNIINDADIIIGTHALIQEDIHPVKSGEAGAEPFNRVKFKNLALVIIDEQHRFGVEQRKILVEKSGSELMPHFLSMTATPIPRSLALALYGDLDLSIINQMPKDRKKIITKVVAEDKRAKAYEFIREQIKQGRQVFVICPLIDLSDRLGVKSVEEEYKKLDKIIFPDLVIGKLHGRMKSVEKEKIMSAFASSSVKASVDKEASVDKAKRIDILVSTSVVEVGVDVPNASVMMIEGADRFGLAQLHQFRGRVGRSVEQSYCFLFTDNDSEKTLKRLEALVKYNNGFDLAKVDLKFRGPGEVYGIEQKGFLELKMASLFDYGLMKQARDQAIKLLELDANLDGNPALKEQLGEWEKEVHLE